jgi:hypothetical protein
VPAANEAAAVKIASELSRNVDSLPDGSVVRRLPWRDRLLPSALLISLPCLARTVLAESGPYLLRGLKKMTRIAGCRTLLTGAALVAAGILIVGCGSQDPSSSASGSASANATSPTSAAQSLTASPDAGPTTSADSSPTASSISTEQPTSSAPTPTTTKRLPMQTATGGEFLSPSGNISCEIDYHSAGLTRAYCQTATPAQSVIMGVTGKYRTCAGQQCIGNSGDGTPTLAYGTATGIGPFLCESATAGVTCTANGRGFRISTSGITSVSG